MNSRHALYFPVAALLLAPLAGFGQVFHIQSGAGNGGTMHLTLLTGPGLTSQPKRAPTQTAEDVMAIDEEIAATRAQLEATNQKLRWLQEQRDALLAKPKNDASTPIGGPPANSGDALHFNFRAPPAPATTLPTLTYPPKGEMRMHLGR